MMKIKKSIESLILASAMLFASSASQAALVTDLLDITVVGGAFDGTTGTGTLDYDKAQPEDNGISTLTLGSGLLGTTTFAISLDIFGQTFTNADAGSATLNFTGATPTVLNFSVDSGITQAGIDSFSFVGSLSHTGNTFFNSKPTKIFSGTIETAVVPVPASAWLFVSGLLGLVGMQRRRKS